MPSAPRPRVDNAMVKAQARAFRWRKMLDECVHATLDDLARVKGVNATYVSRILWLRLPAPEIVERAAHVARGQHSARSARARRRPDVASMTKVAIRCCVHCPAMRAGFRCRQTRRLWPRPAIGRRARRATLA